MKQVRGFKNQLKELLRVGDVGFYTTYDGDYGVCIEFYDKSYKLCHPAESIKKAVSEMCNEEWRVQYARKYPPKRLEDD